MSIVKHKIKWIEKGRVPNIDYTDGRISVIKEMLSLLEKQSKDVINRRKKESNKYKICVFDGVLSEKRKIITVLKNKLRNTEYMASGKINLP